MYSVRMVSTNIVRKIESEGSYQSHTDAKGTKVRVANRMCDLESHDK